MSKKQVYNPYLPSYEYVPDGEPHVFGDRLYIFGSHDKFGGKRYCENDYVCWSTSVDDLSAWEYHGISYQRKQDPDCSNEEYEMYAPDVAQGADGRYYMYYGLSFRNGIKVAVADRPEGPYTYYGAVHYQDGTDFGKRKKELFRFDPAVLVDDDGSVWLYTGFCPGKKYMHIAASLYGMHINAKGNMVTKLSGDMLTIIEEPKYLIPGTQTSKGTGFEGHEFYEASSIRKFDGKYYAIYSSILSHELAHAVSDYPDRGFVYAGPVHSNGNIGYKGNQAASYYWGNNHGSIVKVKNKFYVFGHRPTHQDEQSRQGIAEPILRRADKTFEMAEMTSCGLNQEPLESQGMYEAGIACVLYGPNGACKTTIKDKEKANHPFITQDGEDREEHPAQYIANMREGAVAGFKYFKSDSASVTILADWTNGKGDADGILEVFIDADLQHPAGSMKISGKEKAGRGSAVITIKKESYPLFFRYQGRGSIELRNVGFGE